MSGSKIQKNYLVSQIVVLKTIGLREFSEILSV